jgi:hypothetical protein
MPRAPRRPQPPVDLRLISPNTRLCDGHVVELPSPQDLSGATGAPIDAKARELLHEGLFFAIALYLNSREPDMKERYEIAVEALRHLQQMRAFIDRLPELRNYRPGHEALADLERHLTNIERAYAHAARFRRDRGRPREYWIGCLAYFAREIWNDMQGAGPGAWYDIQRRLWRGPALELMMVAAAAAGLPLSRKTAARYLGACDKEYRPIPPPIPTFIPE